MISVNQDDVQGGCWHSESDLENNVSWLILAHIFWQYTNSISLVFIVFFYDYFLGQETVSITFLFVWGFDAGLANSYIDWRSMLNKAY